MNLGLIGILESVRNGIELIAGANYYIDSRNPSSYIGSGTAWSDLTGNYGNATLINGVGYNGGTKALVFDGVNDYVQTPVNYSLGVGAVNDFTVTVLFNTVTRGLSGSASRLFVSNYQSTPTPFNIYIDSSNGRIAGNSRGSSSSVTVTSTTVVDDGLNHTVTYRKQGNVYSIFVDGIFETSSTVNVGNCTVTNNIVLGTLNLLLNQGFYKDNYFAYLQYNNGLTNAQVLNNHNFLI